MTLQEAIKSGKPFKRPADKEYMIVEPKWWWLYYEPKRKGDKFGRMVRFFNGLDILAEDWEVKP